MVALPLNDVYRDVQERGGCGTLFLAGIATVQGIARYGSQRPVSSRSQDCIDTGTMGRNR